MKSTILALAVFASAASADYIKLATSVGTTTCDGNVAMIASELIGCQVNTTSSTSFRLSCLNSTSADFLYFQNLDCSGSPYVTGEFPLDMGCQPTGTDSMNIQCTEGEFEPVSPAANIYFYQESDAITCPVSGIVPSIVYSYPCGTCFSVGNGTFASVSCNALTVVGGFYTDSSCSGDAIGTTTIASVGCSASSDGVTNTVCNMGEEKMIASEKKPSAEIEALSAGIQSVRDAVHAKMQEAVAKALAKV